MGCGVIADIFGGKCFLKEVMWVEEGVADCGADADADQVDGTGCYDEAQGGISGESLHAWELDLESKKERDTEYR